MTLTVTALDATLGARIEGVQLRDLTTDDWRAIEAAFEKHGLLVFPDQHLTRDEHIAFATRFGPVELSDGQGILGAERKPLVVDISNVDPEGKHITDRNHPQTRYLAANEGWHSDSSFKDESAKASCLVAIEVTTKGGHTEFADMRAAFDMLGSDEIERLRDLKAWHSLEYAQAAAGAVDEPVKANPTDSRGALHPIIRHHVASGRDSLFIGRHACAVENMPLADGQHLLNGLIERACQPPRTYSHTWTAGDVVIWDNRCALHRATEWDLAERRVLRHVRIAGQRWS